MSQTDRKTVVVTGGAGGIGSAICARFSEEGYAVSAWDRGEHQQSDLPLVCDLASEEDVARCAEQFVSKLGVPQVVIHAAAISEDAATLDSSTDAFARIYDVNVIAAVRLAKAFAPIMAQAGGGAWLHISSINSQFGTPGLAAYAASKGGLDSLTRTMALEWADANIRVNAIAPASIGSPMLLDKFAGAPDPEAALAANAKRHPLARIGKPEDVANLAYFLCSDDANWITGGIHMLDGGAHITRR